MTNMKKILFPVLILFAFSAIIVAQSNPAAPRQQMKRPNQTGKVNLDSLRWRDMCIIPDPSTKTYYMVGTGGRSVRSYSSKDLITWEGPKIIYTAPPDVWGDIPIVSIWAPEMHIYKGKYYLLNKNNIIIRGEQNSKDYVYYFY